MTERVEISKRLVLVNGTTALATRLLSISVLVWLQQYLLKRITPEEYSLLPIMFSVMVFAPFLTAILTSGVKRYVLEAYAKENDRRVTEIVSTILPLLVAAGACLLSLGLVLAWHIEAIFKIPPELVDDARVMFLLLFFAASFRLTMEAYGSGLFVRQRLALLNFIILGGECIRITLMLFLLIGVSTRVVWVVLAFASADILTVIVITLVSRRLVPSQRFSPSCFDRTILRQLLNFGGWSSLYGFSGMIRKAADPIILNRLATPVDVACFHLGSLVPSRLEVLINRTFTGSVSPAVMGMHSQNQSQKLKRSYLRLGRYALWGFLLVIAPLIIYHEQIVLLYVGETYLAAGTVMLLLLAWYPLFYGNVLHTELAKAQVRMRSLALREAACSAAKLLITLLLVGSYGWGAIGAATATFVTYGLGSLLLLWPFGKGMVNATWPEVWREILIPGLAPFIVASLFMLMLAFPLPVSSWTDLIVNAVLGGFLYLAVLWFVMKDIDRQQFRDLLRFMMERRWRSTEASPV